MKPIYKIATVHVSGTEVRVVGSGKIPMGITGAVVEFIYDATWEGLSRNVVFDGTATVAVMDAPNVVELPPEVVAAKNSPVWVGVCGLDAEGTRIIPTLWDKLGTVIPSASGKFPPPAEKGLPVWAQLKAMIGQLPNLDTDAKNNLVAAINELAGKIGDLKELTTDARDNLVNAINEAAKSGSGTAVYILTEGETIQDAPEDAMVVIDPFGEADGTTGTGTPGEDGGYYTPSISQPDASTAQFSFTPSKEGMAEVPPVSVTLPKGKDGVIALTGASVGQIAKIAAVDENGVPTAWGPVEMPGGGGNKKLIAQHVVENLILQPTALDLTTGVFTADAEQLASIPDGASVVLVYNDPVSNVSPYSKAPPELWKKGKMSLAKLSDTTFTIAEVTSYTENSTLDVSGYHFEHDSGSYSIRFDGLGHLSDFRFRIFGGGIFGTALSFYNDGSVKYIPGITDGTNSDVNPVIYTGTGYMGYWYGTLGYMFRAPCALELIYEFHEQNANVSTLDITCTAELLSDTYSKIRMPSSETYRRLFFQYGDGYPSIQQKDGSIRMLNNGFLKNGTVLEVWDLKG